MSRGRSRVLALGALLTAIGCVRPGTGVDLEVSGLCGAVSSLEVIATYDAGSVTRQIAPATGLSLPIDFIAELPDRAVTVSFAVSAYADGNLIGSGVTGSIAVRAGDIAAATVTLSAVGAGNGEPCIAAVDGGAADASGSDGASPIDANSDTGGDAQASTDMAMHDGATSALAPTVMFAAPTSYASSATLLNVLAVADFTGDGKPDVAAPDTQGSLALLLFDGNGDGSFTLGPTFPAPSGTQQPYYINTAQLNADAFTDLVVTDDNANTAVVYLGTGTGFSAATSFSMGYTPYRSTIAEVTGDGAADMIIANIVDVAFSVLPGNGAGGFGAAVVHPLSGASPSAVVAADFDRDGKIDLAIADAAGAVWLIINQGGGSFGAGTRYPLTGVPTNLALADLNGDGRPDVIARCADRMSVLLDKAGGTFAAAVDYHMKSAPDEGMAVADLNHDGKIDLVSANPASGSGPSYVEIFLGNGAGGFWPTIDVALPTAIYPDDVVVADVNADTRPDILIVGKTQLSVLKNLTP